MPTLNRIDVHLTGAAVVGPGLSVFYVDAATTGACAALRTFYAAIQDDLGKGLNISFPASGDQIDPATGAVTGVWTDSPVSPTGGNLTDDPVMGVGARVEWLTAGVRHGRHIRGRTFLVPLAQSAYEGPGMLKGANITRIQNAATTLVGTGLFKVWSRPSAKGASDGVATPITAAQVPDAVSWLRSRRT